MSRKPKVFVPHGPCTVASGDCFREGLCLDNCMKRYEGNCQQQIRALQEQVVQLEIRILALERRP
jgi:hypothetical protein